MIHYSFIQENPQLLEKESQRQKRWRGLLDQNTADLAAIDNTIKEKELELRRHYDQLEEKLKANNL